MRALRKRKVLVFGQYSEHSNRNIATVDSEFSAQQIRKTPANGHNLHLLVYFERTTAFIYVLAIYYVLPYFC